MEYQVPMAEISQWLPTIPPLGCDLPDINARLADESTEQLPLRVGLCIEL
jgi:hypothetical protein